MANENYSELLNALHKMESNFGDRVTKLNKYYIGRLVHFEQQQNIILEESNNLKQELNILNTKFKNACDEIEELKGLITLKNTVGEVGVTPIETNADEFNTNDNGLVCDNNYINTTLNNIFNQHGVSKDLHSVKNELNIMKQNSILNDVVITGIPEDRGENLLTTVNNVLVDYNVEIKPADIKYIYRLKNSKTGINSPILMQLKNEEIKHSIMEKQKLNGPVVLHAKGNKNSLMDFQLVYFKHRLTPENLSLLRSVRSFGRKNHYEFIWTTNEGKILMRKSSDVRAVKISSLKDLENL